MKYSIGQIMCLWEVSQTSPNRNTIIVAKEILVTISEIRENVLGDFSKEPSGTGLRGLGNDGNCYEKHWDSWPEAQMQSFDTQWSMREDGTTVPEFPFWMPHEAAPFHSRIARENVRYNKEVCIVDIEGKPIEPKGDLEKCSMHNTFYFPGMNCILCSLAKEIARYRQEQSA